MIKKLIKYLLLLILIFILVILYLSFFGINTEKFNNIIKSEILNKNQRIRLELKTVKFKLSPFDLSANIETYDPEVFVDKKKLTLELIKTNISLKSFIKNDILIDDLQISTKAIKLQDINLLVRSLQDSAALFVLDKIIKDGFLIGDINLNFDDKGKIKNDYEIKGLIKNAKLSFFKKYNIEDLNLSFKINNNEYNLENVNSKFNQVKLFSPSIKIIEKDNLFLINGKIKSNEKDIGIELLNTLFEDNLKNLNIIDIKFDSDNDFSVNISKKFKISNFNLKSTITLNELHYNSKTKNLKKYFPKIKELIKLKDHEILINYGKNKLDVRGEGKLIIEDKTDKIRYKVIKKNNKFFFDTNVDINKNPLLLRMLSYEKKENINSSVKINGTYKDKNIIFTSVTLKENDNNFLIKNLSLDDKFKISSIGLLDFNYINDNKKKNQINLKKEKKNYKIRGKSFDFSKLIEELSNDDSSSLFNNLNSNIDISINKSYLDSSSYVNNLSGIINYKNNIIEKLKLDSKFPNNKELTLTINTNKNNEKITTLFSNYPKPLLKKYKFIKGFEKGILDFYSIKKKDTTYSVLKINDFKVQEVPVLAKLLTLASLQGIADLLTGEGIRFTDLEMKFSNQKKLMRIEEMYAIGPAISILMDGYIEDKKLISLRGTLVPATTINKTISSIPLIGGILVGKKTGEGVFGVSFKIKGHPEDLKTTVNPIKTLTPRFITRTLEKIKKN